MRRRLDLDFVCSTKRKISFYPLYLIILLCFKRQLTLGISSFFHRKQYGPRARHFTAYARVLLYPDNYRQHCAQRKAPVFKLLRGRFWGFSPRRGDTLHGWGWNLARRPPCQISPSSVQRSGYRTTKTENFLLRFDQNVEHKRPAGAYPLRDFHKYKFCTVCTPLHDALVVKIR